MAVTGLPDPQDSHASIMVRFAYDCLVKMREVTKDLESQLGPDTTELSMRIGTLLKEFAVWLVCAQTGTN